MKIRRIILLLFAFHLSALLAAAQATRPELVVQTGHTNTITVMALSPDGRLLATGSDDYRVKLWDARTGIELRTLQSLRPIFFQSLSFTSDNSKTIAVGGGRGTSDKTVKMWDVAGGSEISSVSGKFDHIAVSPDGATFAASGDDQVAIRIFAVAGGNEIRSLTGPGLEINAIAYSPDGKTVASANQNLIVLWDVGSGQIIRTLTGNDRAVTSVAFSGDGRTLVSGGGDGIIWIWDAATGTSLGTFQQELKESHEVSLSGDGRLFATIADELVDNVFKNSVTIFEQPSGRKLRKITTDPNGAFLLSRNGGSLFVGDTTGAVKVIGIDSGAVTAQFSGSSEAIFSLTFGPNGDEIATGGRDRSLVRWKSGQVPQMLVGHTHSISSVGFSKETGNLVSSSWDKTVRVWSGAREINSLKGHTAEVQSLAASPDGTLIASGGRDKAIKLWNAATGKLVKTLTGHTDTIHGPGINPGDPPMTSPGRISGVSFSPDGRTLISAGTDNTIKLWNVAAGRQIRSTSTGAADIGTLALSPDGKIIAGGGFRTDLSEEATARGEVNGTVILWDAATGKLIREFKGIDDWVFSAAFSPDSKTMVTGSLNNKIQLWDVATGRVLKSFSGISSSIFAVGFSPDGKFIASGSADGALKIWDAATGNELGSLLKFGDDDWLVVTPEGFFDGTPAAWKKLFWRFNNDTFDTGALELYFNDFFHPNLLQDILAGKSPRPAPGQDLASIDRRQPTVSIISADGSAGGRTVRVTTEVAENIEKPRQASHASTGGAQDLRLFRNGSLVKIWHGDLFHSGKVEGCEPSGAGRIRCSADISVTAGDNFLTAYAFNSSNIKSNDAAISVKGADALKRSGTLYVLAVGINNYAETAYNLNFAVPDVEDMSQAVKAQQAKLAGDPRLKQYAKTEVISLTNESATKANILLALRQFSLGNAEQVAADAPAALKAALAKIKTAEPEDALLIYYAGHGVSRGERFYLLPHDFTGRNEDAVSNQGVSDIELNAILENVDAGQLMMVIDACQSGQALGGTNEGRAPMNSKGLAQLAYDKGMSILTAAQSQQAALEVTQIAGKEVRHGLLTYALLTGLVSTDADADKNKRLSDREWIDYAAAQVPLMQIEAMKNRHADIKRTGRGVELVFLNGDKSKDPQKRSVQTPRVFYRRDVDASPLIVAAQ